jgi:hypothetical protein
MSTIWIFKTNRADPTFQVEYAPGPGMMPEKFWFDNIHELRRFLESHRLPGVNADTVLRQLASAGRVELKVAS